MADHYEVLGLPRAYRIDERRLEERYRELSRLLHPDRHAAQSASERRFALEKMIQVNDAWRTLRDPVRRAAWLLAQEGFDLSEGSSGGAGKDLPPTFLMEVMDRSEQLAEARAKRDEAAVRAMATEIRGLREEALATLASAFDARDFQTAARTVGILRTYDRFLGEIRAWEDQIFEETHG